MYHLGFDMRITSKEQVMYFRIAKSRADSSHASIFALLGI